MKIDQITIAWIAIGTGAFCALIWNYYKTYPKGWRWSKQESIPDIVYTKGLTIKREWRPHAIRRNWSRLHFVAFVKGGECAGCRKRTHTWDTHYKWHICVNCSSDQIGYGIAEHVSNPNAPTTCPTCHRPNHENMPLL